MSKQSYTTSLNYNICIDSRMIALLATHILSKRPDGFRHSPFEPSIWKHTAGDSIVRTMVRTMRRPAPVRSAGARQDRTSKKRRKRGQKTCGSLPLGALTWLWAHSEGYLNVRAFPNQTVPPPARRPGDKSCRPPGRERTAAASRAQGSPEVIHWRCRVNRKCKVMAAVLAKHEAECCHRKMCNIFWIFWQWKWTE